MDTLVIDATNGVNWTLTFALAITKLFFEHPENVSHLHSGPRPPVEKLPSFPAASI